MKFWTANRHLLRKIVITVGFHNFQDSRHSASDSWRPITYGSTILMLLSTKIFWDLFRYLVKYRFLRFVSITIVFVVADYPMTRIFVFWLSGAQAHPATLLLKVSPKYPFGCSSDALINICAWSRLHLFHHVRIIRWYLQLLVEPTKRSSVCLKSSSQVWSVVLVFLVN